MMGCLSEAAASMSGCLSGADRAFDGVSIDTRTMSGGELFFAIRGENFDGAEFVPAAAAKDAAGAVVAAIVEADVAQIAVDDTRLALGRLGAAWRLEQAATVVAITGSNGKTTLKELAAACLSRVAPTLATKGNFNNDIGLPLMLLDLDRSHRYAVLEMGANHAGEIAYLTELARPDVVVITNAGPAHLEGFGSIDGVAHAKAEILQGKKRPNCAILNADDAYFPLWKSFVEDVRIVTFGLGEVADVRATDIAATADATRFTLHVSGQSVAITLGLAGLHNVHNACAAAAIADALDVPANEIAAALESVRPVAGRLQPLAGLHGATLYDDSYNANPLSVKAAGEFLSALPGESWIVLGDMAELGQEAVRLHRQLGESLRLVSIDRVFATGNLSRHAVEAFGSGAHWFESADELAAAIAGSLSENVNVLVKGSRSMRMERVVDVLRAPVTANGEA